MDMFSKINVLALRNTSKLHSLSQLGRIDLSWGISEGDTKFLHGLKSMLPKDLGSIVCLGIIHLNYYSS
jgi:hypothetical protein